MLLVLIHSPLVGALTWRFVADVLSARGISAFAPSLAGGLEAGPPYYENIARHVAQHVKSSHGLALIGHSGAGALLAAIAAACEAPLEATVFVDAPLPYPGKSWFESVPRDLGDRLRSLAVGGRLPPWHEWFTAEAVAALLPDTELREQFFSEIPRLPLAYFEEPAPPVELPTGRHAYLLLSEPYAPLAEEAEQRGWRVMRESTDHLAMLTRPQLVTDRLLELLDPLP